MSLSPGPTPVKRKSRWLVWFFLLLAALAFFLTRLMQQHAEPIGMEETSLTGDYLAGYYAYSHGMMENANHYFDRALARGNPTSALVGHAYSASLISSGLESALLLAKRYSSEDLEKVTGPIPVVLDLIRQEEWEEAGQMIARYPLTAGTAEAFLLGVLNAMVMTAEQKSAPIPEFGNALIGHLNPGLGAIIRALLLDANGRLEEALPLYAQALKESEMYPWSMDIYYIISAFARSSDWQKAEEAIDRYLAMNPFADGMETERESIQLRHREYFRAPPITEGFTNACIKLALFCNNFNKHIPGLHYLEYATFMGGDASSINLVKGVLYQSMGVNDEALIAYQSVNTESLRYPYTQVLMANLEHEAGNTTSALNALNELTIQFPQHRYAKLALIRMLIAHKDYTQAIDIIDKSIGAVQDKKWPEAVTKPALAQLYYLRAICHYEVGVKDKEEADIQQSLIYDSQNAEAMNHLGYGWLERGVKLEEAHELLTKALALSPEHPAILDSFGWSLYQQGKYEEALSYIEKALQAMPEDATVLEHLGDIYWRLTRKTQAQYHWERALHNYTDHSSKERVRDKIAHGLKDAGATGQ